MPVEFLTPAQAQRYGRFAGEPDAAQLARYFHLDDGDRAQVGRRHGPIHQLGFAVQLGTVRFLGTFLADPTDVPRDVVAYVARQLDLPTTVDLSSYRDRRRRWDHTTAIKEVYGYHSFGDQPEHFRLVRWLYTRAWLSAERPSVLFDLATAWLVERKVLLPGVTTLARLVAQVRERAAARLWRCLAQLPSVTQRAALEQLVQTNASGAASPLDRLRRTPTRVSSRGLVHALQRLETVRALGVGELALDRLPAGRVAALARYAAAARAQALSRMPDDRRLATLVAFAYHWEAVAQDDALDLFHQLLAGALARAKKAGDRERLRTLPELDQASLVLRQVGALVLDEESCPDEALRAAIFRLVPRERLAAAVDTVAQVSQTAPAAPEVALRERYGQVRRYLPTLLRTVVFDGTQAAEPVLAALAWLRDIEGHRHPDLTSAPRTVVPRTKRRQVFPDGAADLCLYTFCVLEQLRDGLGRRDLYVSPSERWGNPRVKLLSGTAWDGLRPQVCRVLGRRPQPEPELADLTAQLAEAYRQTGAELPHNPAVRLEPGRSGEVFSLAHLDRLDEPPSLKPLQQQMAALLPRVELTDLVLEMAGWTGFTAAFTHISESRARVDDLDLSLCAVLMAEACNVGLELMVRPDVPALAEDRLSWVQQNYVRAETIAAANAVLVEAQARLPLAQVWGGGEVASADGLRFVVPVRTISAGHNRKYFGAQRGITYYNFASDQFTGLHGIVIPGTTHEAPYLLEGLLEQETALEPREVISDTAGYSDVIFGLFWLLGYQFSPRLADAGEARLYRMDTQADHGSLNGLARHQIAVQRIASNWDDLLRVAGSLKLGTVRATELVRSFQGAGKRSGLGRALAELGRVAKTLYLLDYLRDESYRRRILLQLTRHERRHRLARLLFHGQRGELRQRYREGQEDQLGALGLVLNMVVLWNTRYLDAALNHLRATGYEVDDEAVARLSPLVRRHINVLGRYRFDREAAKLGERLRPLNGMASTGLG